MSLVTVTFFPSKQTDTGWVDHPLHVIPHGKQSKARNHARSQLKRWVCYSISPDVIMIVCPCFPLLFSIYLVGKTRQILKKCMGLFEDCSLTYSLRAGWVRPPSFIQNNYPCPSPPCLIIFFNYIQINIFYK